MPVMVYLGSIKIYIITEKTGGKTRNKRLIRQPIIISKPVPCAHMKKFPRIASFR